MPLWLAIRCRKCKEAEPFDRGQDDLGKMAERFAPLNSRFS